MQCSRPLQIRVENKNLYVPCGYCVACRVNKTREWTSRLLHESYISKSTYFLTLSYNEESVPIDENGNMAVCKEDVQKFFKRLRKRYPDENIRYFLGSEYGEQFGRPHYHCICYNLPPEVLEPCEGYIKGMPLVTIHKGHQSYINRRLNDIWKLGYVSIGEICRERVSYCAKYFVTKQDVDPILQKNFNLMSRRPGIGADYAEQQKEFIRFKGLHSYRSDTGSFLKLPRYYDKKIYTDEERKARWQENITEINAKVLSDPIINKSVYFDRQTGALKYEYSDDMRYRDSLASQNYKLTHNKDLH